MITLPIMSLRTYVLFQISFIRFNDPTVQCKWYESQFEIAFEFLHILPAILRVVLEYCMYLIKMSSDDRLVNLHPLY